MGANWFTTYSRGKNVKEAYNTAVENADYEYGHQEGYSGHINCSSGFRDVTKEFKASGKTFNQYIDEQMEKLTKHQGAQAICIEEPRGNENKIKTQVEHIVTPGARKWVLKYVVQHGDHMIGSWNTKADAVKDARRYTEQNQLTTTVVMKKFIEKGDTTVAKITYKKSSNEKDGKWIFFGWASY